MRYRVINLGQEGPSYPAQQSELPVQAAPSDPIAEKSRECARLKPGTPEYYICHAELVMMMGLGSGAQPAAPAAPAAPVTTIPFGGMFSR